MTSLPFSAEILVPMAVEVEQSSTDRTRWMRILPSGSFQARDGRGPFHAGGLRNMEAIVKRSLAYLGGTEMMVDYDHQIMSAPKTGGRAEAAGWVKKLAVKPDGIHALVEWTEAAAAKIKSGEYRYLSPVFQPDKHGVVHQILNVGLVNMPALDLVAASQEIATVAQTTFRADLLALLDLPDESGEAAILEAVRALLARTVEASAHPDPSAYVPMSMFTEAVAEANKLRSGISEAEAVRVVDAAVSSGALMPLHYDWAIDLCKVNLPAFKSFLATTGPAVMSLFGESQYERARGKIGKSSDEQLSEIEETIATALDLSRAGFIAARDQSDT